MNTMSTKSARQVMTDLDITCIECAWEALADMGIYDDPKHVKLRTCDQQQDFGAALEHYWATCPRRNRGSA